MVSVYLKPTNFCNVGCEHCYLSDKVKADKTLMTIDTIFKSATLLKEMSQDLGRNNGRGLHIIFHGGEPLMAPPEWYDDAMNIFRDVFGEEHVSASMQSSLMPDVEKHIDVLKKYIGSSIGASVDFTSRKIDGSNDKYLKKFLKKCAYLKENGININCGIVPATGDLGREKQIIDWFLKNDFHSFRIERMNAWGYETDVMPTNEEHSDFLIRMLDYVLERMKDGSYIDVKSIVAAVGGVLYGRSGDTYGGTCQTDMITIEPNGDVALCPNRISYEDFYGNVSDGWQALRSNQRRRNWIVKQNLFNYSKICGECDFVKWCKGCCPISDHNVGGEKDDCAGFRKYLLHIEKIAKTEDGRKILEEYYNRSSIGQMVANNQKMRAAAMRKQNQGASCHNVEVSVGSMSVNMGDKK